VGLTWDPNFLDNLTPCFLPSRNHFITMPATTPTTFSRFSDLPTEIRIEIWQLAATSTATNPGKAVCTFPEIPYFDPESRGHHDEPNRDIDHPVVFEVASPAMLSTNYESRTTALKCGLWRPYNPKTDVIYVPPSRLPLLHTYLMCLDPYEGYREPRLETWINSIRHLATHHWQPGLEMLRGSLRALTFLKTVSLIFPQ